MQKNGIVLLFLEKYWYQTNLEDGVYYITRATNLKKRIRKKH